MGYRIQGAGCRMQVQGELVMLKVCVELLSAPPQIPQLPLGPLLPPCPLANSVCLVY